MLGPEQRGGPIPAEVLDLVDHLAAAVVALPRGALRVLVVEPRPQRLEDSRRRQVLGRDELEGLLLAPQLSLEKVGHRRVHGSHPGTVGEGPQRRRGVGREDGGAGRGLGGLLLGHVQPPPSVLEGASPRCGRRAATVTGPSRSTRGTVDVTSMIVEAIPPPGPPSSTPAQQPPDPRLGLLRRGGRGPAVKVGAGRGDRPDAAQQAEEERVAGDPHHQGCPGPGDGQPPPPHRADQGQRAGPEGGRQRSRRGIHLHQPVELGEVGGQQVQFEVRRPSLELVDRLDGFGIGGIAGQAVDRVGGNDDNPAVANCGGGLVHGDHGRISTTRGRPARSVTTVSEATGQELPARSVTATTCRLSTSTPTQRTLGQRSATAAKMER